MTDGVPTSARHRELEGRLKELMAARKLSVFVFGIGRADLSELCSISPGRPPMRVNDQKFPELFAWLSRSVRHGQYVHAGRRGIVDSSPG